MKPELQLRQLTFGYNGIALLEPSDLHMSGGQLVGLCGLNGSGKSSLFRIIAGLETNYTGDVLLNGQSLRNTSIIERSQTIAVVTTERPRLEGIDVWTLFEMAAHGRVNPEQMAQHIEHCLHVTDTAHMAHRRLAHLSDGELQKVMFGRALAQNTSILLADEPTAFLDYRAKQELTALMRKLAHDQNKLIFFSSHDLELVKEFADIRYALANGKLNRIAEDQLI
jgi:iron complex transport system ATP-binding protein